MREYLDRKMPDGISADASSDPWLNHELVGYTVLERLGEGGMGIVYLGRHESLNRRAAIKFLSSHLAGQPAYVARFLNEAKAAAQLNHPNLVGVYDAGRLSEDVYYFIMEYVEGRTLLSLQKERGKLPVAEAVGYARQAASALGYAHQHNVVHRDVKPENLMLTPQGQIKVGDLGLAKVTEEDGGGLTQSGMVLGTPYYIAPEQVRGSARVDGRADIYSLGCTLFHLITGRIPYEGSSPAMIMAAHVHQDVPNPKETNPELDDRICEILQRMMAKETSDRYATMEDVDAELAAYLQGGERPGLRASWPPSPSPIKRRKSASSALTVPDSAPKAGWIIGASLVASALILGGLLVFALHSSKPNSPAAAPAVAAGKPAAEKKPEASEKQEAEKSEPDKNEPEMPPPTVRTYDVAFAIPNKDNWVLPKEMAARFEKDGRTGAIPFRQTFENAAETELPKGTQCLYLPSGTGTARPIEGGKLEQGETTASWSVSADSIESAKNNLELSLSPADPAEGMAAQFELLAGVADHDKAGCVVLLMQSGSSPVLAKIFAGAPEGEPIQQVRVTERWREYVIALPAGAQKVSLAFRGAGELRVGEVRVQPRPPEWPQP